MEPAAMEEALLRVAARVGLDVRIESFDPAIFAHVRRRGGLCRIGGRDVVIVDAALPCVERVAVLAEALAGASFDEVAMAPAVRERIERAAEARLAARAILRAKRLRKRLLPQPPCPPAPASPLAPPSAPLPEAPPSPPVPLAPPLATDPDSPPPPDPISPAPPADARSGGMHAWKIWEAGAFAVYATAVQGEPSVQGSPFGSQ